MVGWILICGIPLPANRKFVQAVCREEWSVQPRVHRWYFYFTAQTAVYRSTFTSV
jgi:hypothetical protein